MYAPVEVWEHLRWKNGWWWRQSTSKSHLQHTRQLWKMSLFSHQVIVYYVYDNICVLWLLTNLCRIKGCGIPEDLNATRCHNTCPHIHSPMTTPVAMPKLNQHIWATFEGVKALWCFHISLLFCRWYFCIKLCANMSSSKQQSGKRQGAVWKRHYCKVPFGVFICS